ncbi:Cytochrome c oxidase subunit 6A [Emydomyces testavorans]|uniref:Cytochrome c oxidase subunit 6A n=1 Tax=Emydomyces testavorans TaxID=2070801 RepID=A0AAF0DHA8_9EURO|nr:Cytochrome c oxidase subunit 6A [Emydomyces testavorans]
MFPQRSLVRTSKQFSYRLNASLRRRFVSTDGKLSGLPDNKFNRERAAVKAHAAATSDLWRKLSI